MKIGYRSHTHIAVLQFRNTSDDRVLSAILERWGVIISPPWLLKFLLWVPQSTRCTRISTRAQGGKYEYKYKYSPFKYNYEYKYSGLVLEYNSSTSTKYYISAVTVTPRECALSNNFGLYLA